MKIKKKITQFQAYDSTDFFLKPKSKVDVLGYLTFYILLSASMRRSSLRGEKSNLFKKEVLEEALHFGLRILQDDEELAVCV